MTDQANPLRQFQSAIVSAAAHYPAQAQTWVALRAGSQGWLVDAAEMAEALVAPSISAIGVMPAGVMGIVAARGKVFTVLNMPSLLSETTPADEAPTGWLVAVSPDFMPGVALWWPELVGMMPSSLFTPSREPRSSLSRHALVDGEGTTWQVLDVPALLEHVGRPSSQHSAEPASMTGSDGGSHE